MGTGRDGGTCDARDQLLLPSRTIAHNLALSTISLSSRAASNAQPHPLPPTAAILPPPIAPWALGPAGCFRDSAGACGICGAPCGGTQAAASEDPFHSDWPHW